MFRMRFVASALCVLSASVFADASVFGDDSVTRAVAEIRSEDNAIQGNVTFEQENIVGAPCVIRANIKGLPDVHGFSILDWGNMVAGCYSMGNTFNPDRLQHASFREREHRVGTLGNIVDGKYEDRMNHLVSLSGRNSVIGRGIAVFDRPDDEGQSPTAESRFNGDVGHPIACGIIARMGQHF